MRQLLLGLCLVPILVQAQVNFTSSNLPIVIFNTNGELIVDQYKIPVSMKIINNGAGQINHITDPPNDYNGWAGVEIRGNTSQWFTDKKPYSVELQDANGDDFPASILGMPEESDWVFLSPFSDKTLIRDALAHELARSIRPWAPRTRFVELVINGEYRGIYLIVEKIKRDKDRVNISKLKSTDTAGDSLTGGYIIKLDKTSGGVSDGWKSPYRPKQGSTAETYYQYHYPKPTDIQSSQSNYISSFITEFETAMASNKFADTLTGYPKYINVESFIDYTLINELAKNIDAYRLSTFFYKDRSDKDPFLYAGPVWDFNIAFSNADYCNGNDYTGWVIDFNDYCGQDQWLIPFWWKKMWEDINYGKKMEERWELLRQGPFSDANINNIIDSLTDVVAQAQSRNFQKWPILYQQEWPNVFCCGSYAEHVSFMRNWTLNRLNWMDNNIKVVAKGTYKPNQYFTTVVYPNPSSGQLFFECYTRFNTKVEIRMIDMLGRVVHIATPEPEINGKNILQVPHNLSPGIYFYQVNFDGKLESSGTFIVGQ